jgi:N-acetylmuramic acid 6-phosphate (MurNAc-6-P) etherase
MSSAPYVASQLDYAMDNEIYECVLLGFNSVELARNAPIENWNKTFREVAVNLQKRERHFIINPIVGPETITGSTRMKV